MSIIKYENFSAEYVLNGEAIDLISAKVEEFLYSLDMERTNVTGIRLSVEEALLRWYDHFSAKGETPAVKIFTGKRFLRPVIYIELKGEAVDPFEDTDSGDWVGTVMGNIGLNPRYSYQKGSNILQLNINKPRRNPGLWLLMGILAGSIVGFLGKAVLSDEAIFNFNKYFFGPMQDLFFRLLTATAGPVIFFTVLTAICGIGSAAIMNKSGKRMIFRFILSSSVITLVFTLAGILILNPDYYNSPTRTTLSAVFNVILNFIPGDIMSPFEDTDSTQLITLAIIIGNALLVLGSQADRLVKLANQANALGLLIAEWISRLIPFFVAFILALRILDGTYTRFRTMWIPLVYFHAFVAVLLFAFLLRTSKKYGVPLKTLWQKIKPSFMIAFRNASVDAAFGQNRICCERKLGINEKLVDYGLPLGLVIYMPVSTISLMASTLYAIKCYNMTVSTQWVILAMILVVALQAASPPVSGVDTLAYAAIFTRMGIPSEALIMAIICDIIFCFTSSAGNQLLLQLDLIDEANRLDELDKDVLRR